MYSITIKLYNLISTLNQLVYKSKPLEIRPYKKHVPIILHLMHVRIIRLTFKAYEYIRALNHIILSLIYGLFYKINKIWFSITSFNPINIFAFK